MRIKKILLVILMLTGISLTTMAQNNYDKNWKKIEDLEKKGLTKSALQEVMIIYNLALKEGNDRSMENLNTKAFTTRLNWLSAKFKDIDRASCAIDPSAGTLTQTSIDDLIQSLGL